MADLVGKLYKVGCNGIYFPCISFDTKSQMRVEKVPFINASGNYQNVLGRESDVYSVVIPLMPLAPGPSEIGEDYSDLFPVKLQELKKEFAKGEVMDLIHPLEGVKKVVAEAWGYVLDGKQRNGTIYEVQFVEHVDPAQSSIPFLKPIGDINSTAVSFDTIYGPAIMAMMSAEELKENTQSFEDLINQLTAYVDQGVLYAERVKGIGDRIIAKCETFLEVLERAENKLAKMIENSPLPFDPAGVVLLKLKQNGFSPAGARDQIEIIKEYCYSFLVNAINQGEKTISFIVPSTMSVFSVSFLTQNTVAELCSLNSFLAKSQTVKANTSIYCYAR